jgi:hypothetical protein
MLCVWWKSLVPHRNTQRKTVHFQKAKRLFAILVAAAKPATPHKERRNYFENCKWGRGRDLNPGERLAASTQTELGPQASMLPSYITPATYPSFPLFSAAFLMFYVQVGKRLIFAFGAFAAIIVFVS